ncbi:MAG TPA: substrate-binding domain-containing protein [Clostridia bacterium]|jgi:phosphate transport system substrate-binding protein|nr:substrate-binding domain-containing protein [Clostridia bacterium]
MKKQVKIIMVVLCICALVGTIAIGLAGCKKDAEKDITVISREDGSGTRDAFDSLIKKDGASLVKDANGKKYTTSPFVKSIEMLSKTGDVKTKVSSTKTAIGYISLGSLDNTVKALTINGVVASSENVLNGTYLLKRPFVIVTSNSTTLTAATDDFVKYLKSSQAQIIVKGQKYVEQASTTAYTAPATAVSGTIYIKGSTSVDPLMDKLIADYQKIGGAKVSGIEFEKDAQGSSHGITAAKEDTTGNVIGMSSSAIKTADAGSLSQFNIALDAVAVIVHKDNGIQNVTIEQLFDIYTGAITKFSQITA